jgi:hypothetical protein
LYGDTNAFRHKFPEAKNVVPMLIATCAFSDDAQEYALIDSIDLLHLPYKPPFHANGPCYLDKADSDYASFLKSLINAKQHPAPIEVKQTADRNIPSVNQTPEKPEQPTPSVNQTPEKPEQPALLANQNQGQNHNEEHEGLRLFGCIAGLFALTGMIYLMDKYNLDDRLIGVIAFIGLLMIYIGFFSTSDKKGICRLIRRLLAKIGSRA